jgi:hypothetical protein
MSKRFFLLLAGGLVLAGSVVAQAADSDYVPQGNIPVKNGVPQIKTVDQVRSNARRFYSYQPETKEKGRPVMIQTFTRPASAKALGNY